jgi:hypothetical protein
MEKIDIYSTTFCLVGIKDDESTETIETYNTTEEVLFAYFKAKSTGKHFIQNDSASQKPMDLKKNGYVDVFIDVEIYETENSIAKFDTIDNYVEYFL